MSKIEKTVAKNFNLKQFTSAKVVETATETTTKVINALLQVKSNDQRQNKSKNGGSEPP